MKNGMIKTQIDVKLAKKINEYFLPNDVVIKTAARRYPMASTIAPMRKFQYGLNVSFNAPKP